jgi:ubiquinone/menaquinone biosynthesis C-methylase UbiE
MVSKENLILAYSRNFPEINDNRTEKAKKIIKILQHFIPELNESKIADLGCSNGIITTRLAAVCKSIHGLDKDISQVINLDTIPSNCTFTSCDILNTTFPDKSFDIVVCNHVYQWFDRPDMLAREIERITKESGYIYFSGPSRFAPIGEHKILFAPFFPAKARKTWIKFWNKKKDFVLTYLFPHHIPRLFKNSERINLFAYFVGIPQGAPQWISSLVNLFSWISPTFVYLFKKPSVLQQRNQG